MQATMMLLKPSDAQTIGIIVACLLMLADIISGFLAACVRRKPSSTKMREGLKHKSLLLVLIASAYVIEAGARVILMPVDIPTCEAVCAYIAVMELLSVTENVARGYPAFKRSRLYNLLKGKEDASDGKDTE